MKTMKNKNGAAQIELVAVLQLLESTKSTIIGSKIHLEILAASDVAKVSINGNLEAVAETLEVVCNSLNVVVGCVNRAYKSLNQ